jgi:hypothetical protein
MGYGLPANVVPTAAGDKSSRRMGFPPLWQTVVPQSGARRHLRNNLKRAEGLAKDKGDRTEGILIRH